jgi:predicted MFS family arabinose efflux permease
MGRNKEDPKRTSLLSGILILFAIAHFAHHLLAASLYPLLPFIRNNFRLDYTQSAGVVSAFSFANGIGQLPGGWLADRIDSRILIALGISGVALAGILIGLSQTYVMLLVFLVLMGALGGGYHPSAAPTVASLVKPEVRGRALGLHEIGAGAAFFIVPVIAAAIAASMGWRFSFIVLAIPTLIYGVVFYQILRRRAGSTKARQAETNYHDDTSPTIPSRIRRLVAFLILIVASGAIVHSALAFLTLYIVDELGASEQAAATLLSVMQSAGLWASVFGGYLSDRLGKVKVVVAINLITTVCIYLLTHASFGVEIGTLLLVIGVCTFMRLTVSESYIMEYTTERRRSTVYGIYYFSMTETGAVLAPVMGHMIDNYGFQTSFSIASIALVSVTLVCALFLWCSRK